MKFHHLDEMLVLLLKDCDDERLKQEQIVNKLSPHWKYDAYLLNLVATHDIDKIEDQMKKILVQAFTTLSAL